MTPGWHPAIITATSLETEVVEYYSSTSLIFASNGWKGYILPWAGCMRYQKVGTLGHGAAHLGIKMVPYILVASPVPAENVDLYYGRAIAIFSEVLTKRRCD